MPDNQPAQNHSEPAKRPERVLYICYCEPSGISTIAETVDYMQRFSKFQMIVHNLFEHRLIPDGHLTLKPDVEFNDYDAVLIHNSVAYNVDNLRALDTYSPTKLKEYKGVKILMKQDENHRFEETARFVGETKFDIILTCLAGEDIPKVYPPDVAGTPRFERMLTGYVTPVLRGRNPRNSERPVDIGYRGSIQPLHFGRAVFEKRKIGDDVARLAGSNVKLDISSRWEDRFGGFAWLDFLSSCKATLGTESGASVFDLDGELSRRCKQAEQKLGPQRDDFDYIESYLAEFADLEDNIFYRQISPRHFEAAATGTAQILYPGQYSGILEPDRHYFALEKDYSNLDAAIDFIHDERRRLQMTETAYTEIILDKKYWIETFVEQFDGLLESELSNMRKLAIFSSKIQKNLKSRVRGRIGAAMPVMLKIWQKLPQWLRNFLKPLSRIFLRAVRN